MTTREVINQIKPLASRADVPQDVRDQLEASIENLRTPRQTDVWIYRAVVIILGILAILAAAGALVMALQTKDIPESLVALGSTAVGALAGLLAPSPSGR